MTSKVPNEILIKIFQQLHPVDQMECTLVCHRWNKLIEDSILYHTVFLFSSVSLKKLLQKIQQRPDIANRIEKLVIHPTIEEEEAYSSSRLLSLVPNLKVLCHSTRTVLKNKAQYPWYNQIEYISEDTDEEVTDYFLSSDAYPNLKTFSYCYYGVYHPLLKNASSLTSLILVEVLMGFNDLEAIHKNLHHLKSLKVGYLYYRGGADLSGKAIIPATSVTEFVAYVDNDANNPENLSCPELHVELLVYISRKYPNLSTLKYTYNDYVETEESEVIRTGLNPLLQKLGPQLKKVSIFFQNNDDQEELIEMFDKFGCQINSLDLCWCSLDLAKMAQSKQAFYIQTLVLCIDFTSLDWLKSLRVLKKLKLLSNDSSIKLQLSDILDNSPPTLESLSLDTRSSFDIDPSYTGTSNIKTLTFQSMKFDDKVDGFISRCFPQLTGLELRNCELQNNRLNLEKTDLANFCYYNADSLHPLHCDDVILVTTLKDNKRRSYVLHDKQHGLEEAFYPQNYRPFKSYPASDIDDPKPALNFICNSVRNVVFTDQYYI